MQLDSFHYDAKRGWSLKSFPKLDSENTMVMVYGAPEYKDKAAPLAELAMAYPKAAMVGCSSVGEISGSVVNDHSLSVAVARFDHTRVAFASTPIAKGGDSYKAGEALAAQLAAPGLRAVFVLSDGLAINGSELVKALVAKLPSHVVITGGLAGDGTRFQDTWVIRDRKPASGFVTAVGLYGDRVRVGYGAGGGWDAFGPERRITRAQGNVLYELDGKPALALYKEYLGDKAAGLPGTAFMFPLSIRQSATDPHQIVRTVLAIDEANQSLTFAGDVPRGYLAQLTRANFDRLVGAATVAANRAKATVSDASSMLTVAISCVGRRLVLGERTEEEIESTLDHLPKGSHQIGFYSYGEISPLSAGTCALHNQTMTLTTFHEA